MRAESDDYEQSLRRTNNDLWVGEDTQQTDSNEDRDVEITSIRSPITVNHNYPAVQTVAQTNGKSGRIEPDQPKPGMSKLAKAALLAAGLAGGGGAVAAAPWLMDLYNRQTTTTIHTPAQHLGVDVEVVPGGAMK